ncbi:hypothetical protein [Gemmatimonas sp.]|uniref:hypothetical protein n=1 Tax=Gemmatimonas sp. TaxID=1962908 RepID=UPI003DA4D86E
MTTDTADDIEIVSAQLRMVRAERHRITTLEGHARAHAIARINETSSALSTVLGRMLHDAAVRHPFAQPLSPERYIVAITIPLAVTMALAFQGRTMRTKDVCAHAALLGASRADEFRLDYALCIDLVTEGARHFLQATNDGYAWPLGIPSSIQRDLLTAETTERAP